MVIKESMSVNPDVMMLYEGMRPVLTPQPNRTVRVQTDNLQCTNEKREKRAAKDEANPLDTQTNVGNGRNK